MTLLPIWLAFTTFFLFIYLTLSSLQPFDVLNPALREQGVEIR